MIILKAVCQTIKYHLTETETGKHILLNIFGWTIMFCWVHFHRYNIPFMSYFELPLNYFSIMFQVLGSNVIWSIDLVVFRL